MPWVATGVRREVEGEREAAVQGGKWGCFTRQSLSNGQGGLLEVGGDLGQLW